MAKVDPRFASLVAAGFDAAWLAQIVQEHGSEVLDLLSAALTTGFTPVFFQQLATFGGKLAIEVLMHVLNYVPAGTALSPDQKVKQLADELAALINKHVS